MGSISARKFNQILENLEKILAIELMYAAQALEFRRPNTFSPVIEKNFSIIREKVAKLEEEPDLEGGHQRNDYDGQKQNNHCQITCTWISNNTFNKVFHWSCRQ